MSDHCTDDTDCKDVSYYEILTDIDNSREERLKALVELLDERVYGPNGPAYSAFSEASEMLNSVLNDKSPHSIAWLTEGIEMSDEHYTDDTDDEIAIREGLNIEYGQTKIYRDNRGRLQLGGIFLASVETQSGKEILEQPGSIGTITDIKDDGSVVIELD